jgi:hypothetical protein
MAGLARAWRAGNRDNAVKRFRMRLLVLAGCVVVLMVYRSFEREYVMVSDGLVGVTAVRRSNSVVVSGAIRASSAKVTRTTVARYGEMCLIRVYAAAIEPQDDPKATKGTFRVVVPLGPNVKAITVGDAPRSITIGRAFGFPVRVPRLTRTTSPDRVVWHRPA